MSNYQVNLIDDIILEDIRDRDGDLTDAYSALDFFLNERYNDQDWPEALKVLNNTGNAIINALNIGGEENIAFASYAAQKVSRIKKL